MEPIPPQANPPLNVPPNVPPTPPSDSSQNVFKVIPEAKAALNPGLIKPISSAPAASSPVSPPVPSSNTKRFLSGKLLLTLIVVVVLGGGVAAGYFIFPKQFYNTVGKYIGLPAPTEVAEEKTNEEDASEPAESDTAHASMMELFKELPGEDANILIALRPNEEIFNLYDQFNADMSLKSLEYLGETSEDAEDEEIEEAKNAFKKGKIAFIDWQIAQLKKSSTQQDTEAVIRGLTVDPEQQIQRLEEEKKLYQFLTSITAVAAVINVERGDIAVAAKIPEDFRDYVAGKMATNEFKEDVTFTMKENGIGLWTFKNTDLKGSVLNNPLFKNFEKQLGKQLVITMKMKDIQTYLNTSFGQLGTAFPLHADSKASSTVTSAALQKEGETIKLLIEEIRFFDTEENAQVEKTFFGEVEKDIVNKPYKEFLEMEITQEGSIVKINITINDLKGLWKKVTENTFDQQKDFIYDESKSLSAPSSTSGEKIKRPR